MHWKPKKETERTVKMLPTKKGNKNEKRYINHGPKNSRKRKDRNWKENAGI